MVSTRRSVIIFSGVIFVIIALILCALVAMTFASNNSPTGIQLINPSSNLGQFRNCQLSAFDGDSIFTENRPVQFYYEGRIQSGEGTFTPSLICTIDGNHIFVRGTFEDLQGNVLSPIFIPLDEYETLIFGHN